MDNDGMEALLDFPDFPLDTAPADSASSAPAIDVPLDESSASSLPADEPVTAKEDTPLQGVEDAADRDLETETPAVVETGSCDIDSLSTKSETSSKISKISKKSRKRQNSGSTHDTEKSLAVSSTSKASSMTIKKARKSKTLESR